MIKPSCRVSHLSDSKERKRVVCVRDKEAENEKKGKRFCVRMRTSEARRARM